MKVFVSTLIILISISLAGAQQLYMPRNIAAAFKAGTHSPDGSPGPNYWQNRSVHDIHITVAPPSRRVTGSEEIVYTNNSPHDLAAIVLRLELNFHSPEAQRERPVDEDVLSGEISIDEFSENGAVKDWHPLVPYKGNTWNVIKLAKPLAHGESVKLGFKWHYDLAPSSDREGAIDQSTFYLAYFYPRVAVMDDTAGWDIIDFRGGHEFYNDFNDYTFDVTVPKNYVVWATGDLQNADEVLQPKIAERLKRSFTADDVTHVATLDELKAGSITKQNQTNTWKWKAQNVTDVAIALSDHYIWDAGSVVVDNKTGRRASVQSAYDEPSKDFTQMVDFAKHTLDYASNQFPGWPYPYPKMTVVRGFADMEYPMMANDSSQKDPNVTKFIAEHEIMHTYFPFFMGITERRYPFMDEGWATAFEYMIGSSDVGKEKAGSLFKGFRVESWITSSNPDADIPIITPGDALTGQGFGNNEYGRAALGYLALKDMLGDDLFKKGLHKFISNWNGKHPVPWDMFNSFNTGTGKDLNWFFNNWYFTTGYIDLGVDSVTASSGGSTVVIRNIGGAAAPVDVIVTYNDGTVEKLHQTSAIWQADQRLAKVEVSNKKQIKSVTLDGDIWMDADPSNNTWPSN